MTIISFQYIVFGIITIAVITVLTVFFIYQNIKLKASKKKIASLESELSLSNIKVRRDKTKCDKLKDANILIVDDDEINQRIMQYSFGKTVKNIDIAMNGREAVEKFIAGDYHIIFMDLYMPVMDGFQATRVIRGIEARNNLTRTPIIAKTVNSMLRGGESENRKYCLNLGFDEYISIPFLVEQCIIIMKNLLNIPMKKLVVLTGAGISKESGIDTFRDTGGIWTKHDFMEVCHVTGWNKNPLKVLNFMNNRRREYRNAEPNHAHRILARLEPNFDVTVITQNIDDLHERGGSSKIIHLHGEMTKARSSVNPNLIVDAGERDINLGDRAHDGSQLRPHVVMFGEAVPVIQTAVDAVKTADIFVIIGTSLNVFPASKLIHDVKDDATIYLIDPNDIECYSDHEIIKTAYPQ